MPRCPNASVPRAFVNYIHAASLVEDCEFGIRLLPSDLSKFYEIPRTTAWRYFNLIGLSKIMPFEDAAKKTLQFFDLSVKDAIALLDEDLELTAIDLDRWRTKVCLTHTEQINREYKRARILRTLAAGKRITKTRRAK